MRARTIVAPTLLAAALAAAYLIWSPPSQDLAAATFRAELFAEHGFVLWNNQWYSGHHLLSYSVLYPPLAALLGVRLVGALAVVAAAAVFAVLAQDRFGARALVPALWFAAGAASWLLTGRMPFLLAVPFGLAALLAADRGRPAAGALLAALSSLASPVAGLFVALAGTAIGLAGARARGAWLALGAAAPILVLNLAFPVGGEEPFVFDAFIAVPLLAVAVIWLVPAEHRALRIGALLYAALALLGVRGPEPARRQRHPARRAARRPGAGARALAARAAGRGRGRDPAPLLAADRPGSRRSQGNRRPVDRARLLRAADRAAAQSSAGAGPDPADRQPLGGDLRRARAADRARLAAPARVRRLRALHR